VFRNLAPLLRKPPPSATVVLADAVDIFGPGSVVAGGGDEDGDGAVADGVSGSSGSAVLSAYVRVAPTLYRSLYARTGSAQDAEDLLMDVFVQAWRYRSSIGRPDAWFFTVAKRVADRFMRRRRPDDLEDAEDIAVSGDAGATRWDDHDPGSPVIVAFFALREADRMILILRGFEARTMVEVAALLGINEAAARKRWIRARKRYFKLLIAVGVTPPNVDRWARS